MLITYRLYYLEYETRTQKHRYVGAECFISYSILKIRACTLRGKRKHLDPNEARAGASYRGTFASLYSEILFVVYIEDGKRINVRTKGS